MEDGGDFMFNDQPAKQHLVEDIPNDITAAKVTQGFVQRDDVQRNDIGFGVFREITDQSMPNFTVRTGDKHDLLTHRFLLR